MHCILTNTEEYKTLKEKTGLDDKELKARIAVWQEDNGLDKWPNAKDLGVEEFLQSDTAIPLQGNEALYKKYDLLNKAGKIKKVKLGDVTNKWVATLNLSPNYSFKLRNTMDGPKILIFPKSGMFQLTGTIENPIEALETKMKKFLAEIGVKVEIIPEGDFVAKAKIMNKIVQVVQGKADASTLPEEASHFFVALLKANGTLYDKLSQTIESNPIYKSVFEEYKGLYLLENGKPDVEKIKEEAVGKLIAQNIVKLQKESDSQSLLQRAWNMITAVIRKALNTLGITSIAKEIAKASNEEVFEVAAKAVMEGNVSGLKLDFSKSKYEMLQATSTTTQTELVEAIRKLQNRFTPMNEKINNETRHYYLLDKGTDGEKKIEGTPSTIASQDSRKRGKRTLTKSQEISQERSRLRGTKIHDWAEDIVNNYINAVPVVETSTYKSLTDKEKVIYNSVKAKLIDFIEAIKQQDPAAIFLPEVIVYDSSMQWVDDYGNKRFGVAGKLDLLVVHGDGTVSIYDYKTTFKEKGLEEASIWKSYEYNMQVAIYKKMLMNGNLKAGVPKVNGILKSRLIGIVTNGNENNEITRADIVGDIPVAGEDTQNKKLNSKLEGLYERFYKMLKAKPPKDPVERKAYYTRIESIRDTIVNLHLQKNHNLVIQNSMHDFDYANKILNKEDVSLNDLVIVKEISDLYSDLLEYADTTAMTEDIRAIYRKIEDDAKILHKAVEQKRFDIMQSKAEELGTGDLEEVQRQIGFMSHYFRSFSTQNHPMIATLYEMTKKVLYQNEIENNALREEIKQQQTKLKEWASSKGMSLQQAYDLIINKKTGKLISIYKPEFYEEIKKRSVAGDKSWFDENFELNTEAYEKALQFHIENVQKKTFYKNPALNIKKQEEIINEFKNVESNLVTTRYRKIKSGKEAKWKSDDWLKLELPDYAPLMDFHKFFTSKTKEMAGWLPNFGYRNNFIPTVRKTWMEELSKLNGKTATNLFQALKSRLEVNELNTNVGNVSEMTGEVGGSVPVYFINNLSSDELKQGKKSYDLGRILQIFGEMSNNFKNMSEIETAALTGLDILKGQEAYERSSFSPLGLKNNPLTQNLKKSEKANEDYIHMYEDYLNYYLYNVTTKNPSKLTQSLDMLNQYTAFKMLGLNPFPVIAAGAANLAGTQVQIARNVYFNEKQYMKSIWMLSGGRMFDRETKDITYGLMELFLPQIDNRSYAKNRKLSTSIAVKHVTVDHFFAMLRNTDEFNQATVFLSMLQNSTFDEKGNIVLISDYKKNLRPANYYELPRGGEERKKIDDEIKEKTKNIKSIIDLCSIKDGKLQIERHPDISSDVLLSFRQMVRQVNKNIIGNMDVNDIMLAKTNAWARTLLVFRNWMPRAIEERYGELRYNRELQRAEWGRYQTFFNELFKFTRDEAKRLKWNMLTNVEDNAKAAYLKQMSLRPELAGKITEAEFIDLYKENLKASYRGIAITIGVLTTLILGGKYYNDDDELEPGEKFLLKVFRRVNSEMMMFINPVEALNILKTPSAATAPLSDLIRAITHSMKEISGQVINEEDWIKSAKPLKYWMGFNPFTGIEKTYRMFDENWQEIIEDNKSSE